MSYLDFLAYSASLEMQFKEMREAANRAVKSANYEPGAKIQNSGDLEEKFDEIQRLVSTMRLSR